MLITTVNKYKDKNNGKIYEHGDIREVEAERGKQLIAAGVAIPYNYNVSNKKPVDKADKSADKKKGKKDEAAEEAAADTPPDTSGSTGNFKKK